MMDKTTLQVLWRGLLPDLLGIEFIETTQERVTASLVARPELCTVGNILHGGTIMAFADTLGAVATVLNLPPGAKTTTIESKTNFLKAATMNSRIAGECTPLHRGSRTMVWETKIVSEDGKLLAVVTQTQLVIGEKTTTG